MSQSAFTPTVFTANGTTTLRTGFGQLHGVAVTTVGTAGTMTIYDNTAGSGTVIATIALTSLGNYIFKCTYQIGLTIVVASITGSPSATVTWG